MKLKIKKGDVVKIIRGRDRGKQGKLLHVWPQLGRVMIENANLIQKHVRPKRQGEKGSRVAVAASVPVANVALVCPACKKTTRVGRERREDGVVRLCKQCGTTIE